MTTLVVLAALGGALAGYGLVVTAAALRPAPVTLAGRLAAVDDATRRARTPHPAGSGWRQELGTAAVGSLERIGWLSPRVRADLAVTGTPVEGYAAAKAAATVTGLVLPVLTTAALAVAGVDLGLVPLWLAVCAAAAGFTVPDLRLRRAASATRRDARTALSAYLDLVALALASGAGLVEALLSAARIGDGRLFAGLRAALADARTDGISPAAALARLGRDLALPELSDTAARLTLVEGGGAQAAASLHAQAATLRDAEVSAARGAANERSQSLLVAQVLLGLAFLVFLTYPALVRVATL